MVTIVKKQETRLLIIHTQSDIASLIGTSRPTLNILLKELKEDHYLNFNRKEIRIFKNIA